MVYGCTPPAQSQNWTLSSVADKRLRATICPMLVSPFVPFTLGAYQYCQGRPIRYIDIDTDMDGPCNHTSARPFIMLVSPTSCSETV